MTTQHDFILLDRSGSMGFGANGGMIVEAVNGINAYVAKLAEEGIDTGVTLVAFDTNEPFQIVRDRITPKTWKNVTVAEVAPRGGTPLNDATVKLLDLAEQGPPWGGKYDRVSIVIATDGDENSSQTYSRETGGTQKVKTRLERVKQSGWAVTFLGANFDNVTQAASYGINLAGTVSATREAFASTMTAMATKRTLYAASGNATDMTWTADEQASAKTDGAALKKTSTSAK